jgi:hypothetical protein
VFTFGKSRPGLGTSLRRLMTLLKPNRR